MKTLTLVAVLIVAVTPVLPVAQASSPRSIRDIDFLNFSYPELPTGNCSMSRVRVRNGKYGSVENLSPSKIPSGSCWAVSVDRIEYGDVTGDGREEAMVVLYAELGGTSSSNDVFIYTLKGSKPVLLWKFATGDRAEGGLRKIYAENGKLVIELAGKNKFIGGDLYAEEVTLTGACCPTVFTRTKYRWIQDRFRRSGAVQILPFTGWQ
ncbi:MAG: hypothetical protein ACJ74W_14330 [Pyrinomonadaceae bacterium]